MTVVDTADNVSNNNELLIRFDGELFNRISTGSTNIDFVIAMSTGTSPIAIIVHIIHMSKGINDPITIAFEIFFSSPFNRDTTNGIVSVYTNSCKNTGIAHVIDDS